MSGKRVAAIILAAGQSTRMGRPKMLLPWKETTVLGQVVVALADGLTTDSSTDSFTDSRIGTDLATDFRTDGKVDKRTRARQGIATDFEIVVVTGAEREKVEGLVGVFAERYPVRCVFNPAYETGEMLSSLQCGLAGLGPQIGATLIGLGDQPRVESSTARKIVGAFESSGARIIVPSYQMRRGHPWLVEKSLWDEIQALRPPETPREFLNAHAHEIEYVNVDTPSINEDIDTPEDYERFKSSR